MESYPAAGQSSARYGDPTNGEGDGEDDVENEDEEESDREAVDREELFEPVVQTLVAALGGYEEITEPDGTKTTIYRPGDSILPVLRSLKRLWRKDDTDDERTVFRLFSRSTLFPELLALVKECTERGEWGRKIALGCADLITGLTWPIEVEKELRELRDEEGADGAGGEGGTSDYASLLKAQWEYKAMILRDAGETIRCFMLLLLPSLGKRNRDRSERDKKIISLILHLVRNLLAIRDGAGGAGDAGVDGGLQSELIKQLSKANFFSLFNMLANNAPTTEYNEYNVVILDILFLAYKGIDPVELAKDREVARKEGLSTLLEEEDRERRIKDRKGISRHGRFGTTIAVRSNAGTYVLHKQTAISESAANVMDGTKRKRAQKGKQVDELNQASTLSPDALKVLQDFAELFLHSFDPFFSSVLKDIRMMRSKVRETDNLRCLFLSRFFMEYFLLLRAKEQKAIKEKLAAEAKDEEAKAEMARRGKEQHAWANLLGDDNPLGEGPSRSSAAPEEAVEDEVRMTFGLMAEMLEDNTRMWLNKRLRESFDIKSLQPPAYIEIQACLNFSTRLLTLLEHMATDKDERWQEAAMTVSDKVFYHAEFIESAFEVLAGYRDQSIGYLDAAVEFVFTLLKTLEKYTKQRGQLVMRKRRAAGKKKKPDGTDEMDEEDEEGMLDQGPSYRETEVQFKAIEGKLLNERVTKSLMTCLSRRGKTDKEQEKLKRVVHLMHRMAVRRNAEELFFKVSGLIQFKAILDDQRLLPKSQSSKDLLSLVTYVLRKFFKSAEEQPLKLAEAFFPPQLSRSRQRGTASDAEDDVDPRTVDPNVPKAPAELDFKPEKELMWHEKLGLTMRWLLDDNKMPLITWLLEILRFESLSRVQVITDVDGEVSGSGGDDDTEFQARHGPSMRAKESLQDSVLELETEPRTHAVSYNPHFRLLLTLVSYQQVENEERPVPRTWVLPKAVLPGDLDSSIRVIEQYLRQPLPAQSAKDVLRKKRKKTVRRRMVDGEERAERGPRQRKVAEVQAVKSAQFIIDSDEDADEDEAFFAREAARRELYKSGAAGIEQVVGRGKGKKKKKEKNGGMGHPRGSSPSAQSDAERHSSTTGSESPPRRQARVVSLPNTPSTSSASPERKGLRSVLRGSRNSLDLDQGPSEPDDDDEAEEEERPPPSSQEPIRRKKRVIAMSEEE